MAGVKLQKFLGKAPRIAPELLPNTSAQIATNVKLYSGDLIPYPTVGVAGAHAPLGAEPKTLYALRNPVTNDPVWLAWTTDVDVATPAGESDVAEQRFYYTGDGEPRVSTYSLATSGAAPYPTDYYELGLPLPTATPETVAQEFATRVSASYARDASGIVTLKTGGELKEITGVLLTNPMQITCVDHGFSTGDLVYITAVGGTVELNGYTYGITVLDANNFTLNTIDGTSGYSAYTSGGLVALKSAPHGLKSGAFVTVNGFTNIEGTYSQTDTTITVSITGHGLFAGSSVLLRFTSGSATSNIFTVTAVVDPDTFRVEAASSASTSGDVTWDISNLNANSVEITVVDDFTVNYPSPGFQVSETLSLAGRLDLAGDTQARTYLYTWFTPWEEESVGSEPSEALFIKEGQRVTVGNLPTTKPAGKNYIRGIRLYRTLSSTADTEYLRLATLWFPVLVTGYSGNTVTTEYPHNLAVGSYFKISGGVTGAEVTDVVDEYTFVFTGGTGIGRIGGYLYHDVSENPGTTDGRYWGETSYDFVDDFAVESLLNALVTDDYEPPPDTLKGLTVYNNNFLVGFSGNEIYFSEPGEYHAWPRRYKKTVPHDIVGLATTSGYLLVMTTDYAYLAQGSDPAVIGMQRMDARYPCLSKRSIAQTGFGVVYATHDGLALYSTAAGPQLVTRVLYNSDTWNADLDPSTLIATAYKDTYLAWHSGGGISFEQDEKVGGYFVDLSVDVQPSATWFDPATNNLYYASGTDGTVYRWDDPAQPAEPYEWKSKVFVTDNPINIGAAQVDAVYAAASPTWDTVASTWATTGTTWNVDGALTFKFWADGELLLTHTVADAQPFRLPTGYRSDKFEVSIAGSSRVRSIRLAETPTGLREV
jgi:hypothetical protein